MDWLRSHALALPVLVKFAVGLGLIIIVPQICRRLHIPAVVGLLLSGVLFGPYGLEIIGKTRPVADFLGELGKILLMFMAGLEIDLDLFKRVQKRALTFGVITTSLPLILGTVVGLVFGYSVLPAIVIGSLLASHTLLAASTISQNCEKSPTLNSPPSTEARLFSRKFSWRTFTTALRRPSNRCFHRTLTPAIRISHRPSNTPGSNSRSGA